ncbi:MAG: META domain-containing protein [Chloroflexota bacterium]
MVSYRILTVVLMGVLLAACAGGRSPGPTVPVRDLDGTSWRATSLRDVGPMAGAEPTIRFSSGQAGGTTGCNTFGGPYTLTADGSFTVGSVVMTEIACIGELGAQESIVIDLLTKANRLEFLSDGSIRISGPAGAAVFEEDPR